MRIGNAKIVLLLAIIFCTLPILKAQDISSLTGVVTDSSGAVIRGASVVLVDTATNSTYEATTSSTGAYTIPSVRPGPGYKVTFSYAGFQSSVVSQLRVGVGRSVTQNAVLVVGTAQSVVEVVAGNKKEVIDTVDASIGNNLDVKLLNDLPILNRDNPSALFTLQPGVANGSITGARTDQTETTVDSLDVNDIAAGQAGAGFSIISKAPVDSIQEFRGTVAGQLASNGPGGGGQFQLVTKSGTNNFHGLLYEYHRDAQMQANSWFNKNLTAPLRRPPFIQNQFGGNLGGRILRDKIWFFFDFAESRIIQSLPLTTTVPLDSFRNGIVNYVNNSIDPATGKTCSGPNSRLNLNPSCISSLTPAQVASLDPKGVGESQSLLAFINARYPHANDVAGLGNGINTGGFRFNAPAPDQQTTYVARLDYDLNSKMKLFVRGTMNRRNATQSGVRFPGDPVSNPFVDRSYSYVVGHTWTIGGTKVNQFYYGDTITKFNFPSTYDPTGTTSLSLGGLTNPYNSFSTQKRRVPIPEVRDDFGWQKGSHNFSVGGTFKFIKTHSILLNDFNFTALGLGGNTNSLSVAPGTKSLRPSDILSSSATSLSIFDTADVLSLGRVGNISSNYNYDNKGNPIAQGTGAVRHYRYYQTELYAGDSWKVTRAFTLTYGVRYQYYSVPYETTGIQSVQSVGFDQYFAARTAQSASGQSGSTSVPIISYTLGGKVNNGPAIYQPSYKDIAPRFAFAYNPTSAPKTVFNGGAGIVYDRTVINAVNFIQDQSSYLFQQTGVPQPFGIPNDPTNSLINDPRVGANFNTTFGIPAPPPPPSIANPFTPGVTNGVLVGTGLGKTNSSVDPHLKDPYSIAYNAGVQQEFPSGLIMRLNYVGRLGRRLLAQADASQLIDFPDATSGQLLSTAFSNLTALARTGAATAPPQPFFENQIGAGQTTKLYSTQKTNIQNGDFADFVQALQAGAAPLLKNNVGLASQLLENSFLTNKGFSSYNGLLFSLSKNFSHGLQFDFNYTWSHSIDNTSLVANSIAANSQSGFICEVQNPRVCRGPSDFDVRHVVNANFTYELPIGRKRAFLANSPIWLDDIIGGWQASGIPQYRSGLPFSTTSGAFVASDYENAPALFVGSPADIVPHPAKRADGTYNLFSGGPATSAGFVNPIGFTIGSRNSLRGPSLVQFDASLAKSFPIIGDRLVAKFRGDAFNVLNHPVFSTPSTTSVLSGSFGNITSVAVSSRILQVALRLEF